MATRCRPWSDEELKGVAAKVRNTGSYWFQAVPMAAALACVGELQRLDAPRHLAEYGKGLTDGLAAVAAAHGVTLKCSGPPQIPYVRLEGDASMVLFQRFCAECTRRGAYFVAGRNWQVSCAHTEQDLRLTLEVADDAWAALEREDALDAATARTGELDGSSLEGTPFSADEAHLVNR